MTAEPLVSVIIPAYNAEASLARAVNSALSQTVPPREIIVVDDGSTDGTAGVAHAFGSAIRYFRQQNAGASVSRNRGVRESSGELLAFLDADDCWHPRKLELQLALLRRHPELAYCTCRAVKGGKANSPFPPLPADPAVRIISDFREVFRRPYFGTPTVMMPRAVFERCGGFDENLATGEDVDLWLRAAWGHQIGVIEAVLVAVYRTPHSLSTHGTHGGNILAVERFCREHPEFALRERGLVNQVLAEIQTCLGSEALVYGDLELARRALRQALRHRVTPRALYLLGKACLRSRDGRDRQTKF
jgi:glycosyltransferase involved in cell wall biosynthesis